MDNQQPIAFIPAAGRGIRLSPITKIIPKEMFPVGRKPIIHHLVERLAKSGINKIIIAINPQKKIIQQYLGGGSDFGVHIRYVITNPHGIDKALWAAKRYLSHQPFLYCAGDMFIKTPNIFTKLISLYKQYPGTGILTLKHMPTSELSRFAVSITRKKIGPLWDVQSLVEKPKSSRAQLPLVSLGIMILPPAFFEIMQKPKNEKEIQLSKYLNLFNKKGIPLWGYETKEDVYDCSNINEFALANLSETKPRPHSLSPTRHSRFGDGAGQGILASDK